MIYRRSSIGAVPALRGAVATSFERVRLSGSRAVGRRPSFRALRGNSRGLAVYPLGVRAPMHLDEDCADRAAGKEALAEAI